MTENGGAAAHMLDMSAPIARKSQTGEPTSNGGHFGSTPRTEGAVALATERRQPGEYIAVPRHDWLDSTYTVEVNSMTGLSDDELATATADYLAAALWTDQDDDDNPLDANYGTEDFTPEARARAERDVIAFAAVNKDLVAQALAAPGYGAHDTNGAPGQLGHDFWLTRNGHGAGFWDRKELSGELGRELSAAASLAGDCRVFVYGDRLTFE